MEFFDNKKFIFFISLFHHLRKMRSIADTLEKRGANTLFLTAQNHNGCSPNINFEATLIEAGLPYKEVTDYLDEYVVRNIAEEKQNILREFRGKARCRSDVSGIITHTVEKDLMFALVDGIEMSHLMEKVLVEERPDAVFVLHELNFWARILALCCARLGVPLISFQEGLFYEKLSDRVLKGLGEHSSLICLWGRDAREKIIRAGGRSEPIRVTGASHLDVIKSYTGKKINELKREFQIDIGPKVITFITPRLYTFPIPVDFFKSFVEYISRHPDHQFLIKFHPAESDGQIEVFKNQVFECSERGFRPSNLLFFHPESVEDILALSDLILSCGTTASGETLAFRKPLIEVNWKKINYNLNLARIGVAQEIVGKDDFEKIDMVLKKGQAPEIRSNVEKFILDNFYKADGKATERILLEVENTLKNEKSPRKSQVRERREAAGKMNQRKKRKSPDISVIVPTYNRKEQLRRTILAYQQQTISPDKFELVVIDDGSSDGTDQLVEDLKEKAAFRIIYHYQENQGPAAARNWAIANASSDLVLITGDDIIPAEVLLEEHLKAHEKYSEKNKAILGRIDWPSHICVTPLMHYITQASGLQFGFHLIKNPKNASFWFFYTSNISLKRSFMLDNGLFDTSFTHAALEDTELGYRLQKRGLRIVYNSDAVGYHDHSITLESFCRRQFRVGKMAVVFAQLHPKLSHSLGVDQDTDPLPVSLVEALEKGAKELEKINFENLRGLTIDGSSLAQRISSSLNIIYGSMIRDSYNRGILEQKQRRLSDNAMVSVVMPASNDVDQTKKCLEAIIENTPEDLYEVVIIDNSSTDETKEFLACLEGDVKIITNETNAGMSIVFNQGARIADGEYLVFLGSDAKPQEKWLEEILQIAEEGNNIAVVDKADSLLFRRETFLEVGMFNTKSIDPLKDQEIYQKVKDLGYQVNIA